MGLIRGLSKSMMQMPSDRQSSKDPITPPSLYFNRRGILNAGIALGSVAATASAYRWFNPVTNVIHNAGTVVATNDAEESEEQRLAKGWLVREDKTAEKYILNYNNFYEFTTQKEAVAAAAANFKTEGWEIVVDGLVSKPAILTIEDLHNISKPQERVYRMRCVEAWSMVIPWVGVPLSHVLEAVEPTSNAKYVAFETLLDPERMPGQRTRALEWPYVEGLRLDEAMNPLTLLATGIYGKSMPPQDGAPVRLVTPWKYGFKGIKSIVRITLVAEEPPTSWNIFAPHEYGFYANVNPDVDHPRWSQATEQRIGESGRRKTLLFNGYGDQVADLYQGMDLRKFY